MTSPVESFLETHGLQQFASLFVENEVDLETLKILTEADLQELGLPFGPRKRLLHAVRSLRGDATGGAPRSGRGAGYAATVVGERRQLTVFFCDMVGFTELATRLDPEVLQGIIHRYEDACAACVTRYEGYVYQRLGDGILAFFGFPLAHEDEAERAIRAGMEIIQSLSMIEMPEAGFLKVRIGIATGEVVVTTAERGAVGETMNLASRLQGIAQPNSIVVSDRVHRLARGAFVYQDLGEQTLKGIPKPTRAWQVTGTAQAASRFEAATHRGLSPMVGRKREIDVLLDRWRMARSGEGQAVFVSGEPGIGKSRIVSTVRERLIGEGATPLSFQCSPHHVNSAFHPWIDSLERALDLTYTEDANSKLDKLEALMVEQCGRSLADVRHVAAVLSIPTEERYGELEMHPKRRKEETIRALVELIEAVARARPSLMIVEDLHWSDPTSLDVLDLLTKRVHRMPLLIVDTSRPEFQNRWTDQDNVATIVLERLEREESASLVSRLVEGRSLPPKLLDLIIEKADGIPLFVEELTRSIVESGALRDEGDRYVYAGSPSDVPIPATLRDLLTARLDRAKPVKEIAQIGAAIGREFSYELIAAVAPMDRDALDDALAQLTDSGLAALHGVGPNTIFTFKHALVQDAAYESLLRSRRQELHGRIAVTLEESFPGTRDAQPELLAHHYTAAGRADPAVRFWQQAGEMAMQRFALAEACAHLERGLHLVKDLPAGEERDRRELKSRTMLGPAVVAHKGWAAPEVKTHLEPALTLARSLNHEESQLPVMHGLWVNALVAGHLAESERLAGEMLTEAEATSDEGLEICGHRAAMTSSFWLGKLVAARQHGDVIRAKYDPERHWHIASRTHSDPLTGDGIYRGQYLWMLGYPDQALALSLANHEHAAQRNHPFDLAFSLTLGAQVYNFIGRPDELLACAERGEQVGRDHGLPVMSDVLAAISKGIAFLRGGRIEECVPQLRDSIEGLGQTGQKIWDPYLRALLAEGVGKAGDPAAAMALIDESLTQIEERHERPHYAEVLRIKGCLLLQQGRDAEAEACLRAALAFAQAQEAKSWELRAALTLGRHLVDRGEPAAARNLLAPVYAWFTEGFSTKDLVEARALLDELGS